MTGDQPRQPPAEVASAKLRAAFDEACRSGEVPGLVIAASVGCHRVDLAFGVANHDDGTPVTTATPFQIQSVAKILTASLVMQLLDDGLIDLDVPVRRYLPTFRTSDRRAGTLITARHLLTHTAGFEGDLWSPTSDGDDALARFVDHLVAAAAQGSRPGRRFSYCNAGYGVLGRLVEILRGLPYERALRHHLTDPLGIDPVCGSGQAVARQAAYGHVRDRADQPWRTVRPWAVLPASNPAAGNQMAMTASELLAVGRLHLDTGVSPTGERLLTAEATTRMQHPHLDHPTTPTRQGLGWRITRTGRAEHPGNSFEAGALLRIDPKRSAAAAVMCNAGTGSALMNRLLDVWFAHLPPHEPTAPTEPCDHEDSIADPAPYVGTFERRQARLQVFHDTSGRLWLCTTPQHDSVDLARSARIPLEAWTTELRPAGHHRFVTVDSPTTVLFSSPDAAGRFTCLSDDRAAFRTTQGQP